MTTLVDRAKGILLQPGATWKAIDAEFTKPAKIWSGYVVPLAAIGPICMTISMILFGQRVAFTSLTNPVSMTTALTSGVASYVLALLSVFIVSQIVSFLAPNFGGQKNDVQALKAVAYSSTASWVGGVFGLLPQLGLVSLIFSLYTLYLLYAGLPVVMKVPQDRALGYTAVVIIATIVVFLIMGAVVAAF